MDFTEKIILGSGIFLRKTFLGLSPIQTQHFRLSFGQLLAFPLLVTVLKSPLPPFPTLPPRSWTSSITCFGRSHWPPTHSTLMSSLVPRGRSGANSPAAPCAAFIFLHYPYSLSYFLFQMGLMYSVSFLSLPPTTTLKWSLTLHLLKASLVLKNLSSW